MRPGMTCTDCGLTELNLSVCAANDDRCIGCRMMGAEAWKRYVARWNPLRWWPARRRG